MKRLLIIFSVFVLALLLMFGLFSFLPDAHDQKKPAELQHYEEVTASTGYRQKDIVPQVKAVETNIPERKAGQEQFWYRDQVVVLMYHHISDDPEQPYAISRDLFLEHMQFLAENNLHPISLQEFLDFVDTGVLVKENAVLITFDDGYESYYTDAYPILKEFGYPSVNFVISGRLRDVPERQRANMIPPLTYSQVREMVSSGLVDVGSHTYSLHEYEEIAESGEFRPATSPLYDAELQVLEEEPEYRDRLYVDFMISRVTLSDIVNKEVTSLSFPYGFTNEIVRETVRQAGYSYAFTSEPSVVKAGVNPYQITRFNVGVPDMDVSKLAAIFAAARTKA